MLEFVSLAELKAKDKRLWVSVSYCAGSDWFIDAYGPKDITRYVYATREEAYKAKAHIDEMGCGGGCKGWHTVEVAWPKERVKHSYDIERKDYKRRGGTIPVAFLLHKERRQPQRPPSKPAGTILGGVYLIQAEGQAAIKIGHGTNAFNRLKQFQTGCPLRLVIIREIPTEEHGKLEKILHKRYDEYKIHGEWYALPADILAALLKEEFL